MKDLQAKLEQALKDQAASNLTFVKEVESLRKQIADKEVTYSVGDRFTRGQVKYILIWGGYTGWCGLVDLSSGEVWSTGTIPVAKRKITADELSKMSGCGNFTRYWDARKQEKC